MHPRDKHGSTSQILCTLEIISKKRWALPERKESSEMEEIYGDS